MKLNDVERVLLCNQLQILEKLDPGSKEYYEYTRRGIEGGYELMYAQAFRAIDKTVSEERCNQVVEVLDMHRALHFSYRDLADKSGITKEDVKFAGFDGNEETESYSFTKYFCEEPPNGRFTELGSTQTFNSHWPMWSTYNAMLSEWQALGRRHELTADEIRRIINVKSGAAGPRRTEA
jgi:uncharacterized protein YfbU (UPF0304 family)